MRTPFEVLNIGAEVAKDEIVVACSEGSFPVRRAFDDERCGEGRQTPDIVGQSRESPPFSAHISTLYIVASGSIGVNRWSPAKSIPQ